MCIAQPQEPLGAAAVGAFDLLDAAERRFVELDTREPLEPSSRYTLVDDAGEHVRTSDRAVQQRARRVLAPVVDRRVQTDGEDDQPLEAVQVFHRVAHEPLLAIDTLARKEERRRVGRVDEREVCGQCCGERRL